MTRRFAASCTVRAAESRGQHDVVPARFTPKPTPGVNYCRQERHRGFIRGEARSNCLAQIFRRAECNLLACLDFDGLSGCGIAAHPGRALADLKSAKARDPDTGAFFEMVANSCDRLGKHLICLLLG